jgi:hypothetical protein
LNKKTLHFLVLGKIAKTAFGGWDAGARKQRSAEGARVRENSDRRRGRDCTQTAIGGGSAGARVRGCTKTAIGGGVAGAQKQRSAEGSRVRENSDRRRGRGCAKKAIGEGGAGANFFSILRNANMVVIFGFRKLKWNRRKAFFSRHCLIAEKFLPRVGQIPFPLFTRFQ